MIAYGPEAADAVLDFVASPGDGARRPLLSPKSREGLKWVREERGKLPLRLRNALEYLLITLKTSGVDLDDLFSTVPRSSRPATVVEMSTGASRTARRAPAIGPERLPPLPETAEGRLALLRMHADTLDEFAKRQAPVDQRKSVAITVQKLKENNLNLRPSEIGDLLQIYERLRKQERAKRR